MVLAVALVVELDDGAAAEGAAVEAAGHDGTPHPEQEFLGKGGIPIASDEVLDFVEDPLLLAEGDHERVPPLRWQHHGHFGAPKICTTQDMRQRTRKYLNSSTGDHTKWGTRAAAKAALLAQTEAKTSGHVTAGLHIPGLLDVEWGRIKIHHWKSWANVYFIFEAEDSLYNKLSIA